MNEFDILEFAVLIMWALAFVYATVIHHDPGMGTATAFGAYVSAVAVKIVWGNK
jgi:hypothetical protein